MYISDHISAQILLLTTQPQGSHWYSEERADFYTLEHIKTLPHMHDCILLPRKSLGQNIDKSVRKCRGKEWRELNGPLLLPSQRPQHMATAAAVAAKELGWLNSQCPSALGSRAQSGRTHSSPHTLKQSKHRLTTRQHWKALHPFILLK